MSLPVVYRRRVQSDLAAAFLTVKIFTSQQSAKKVGK